MAYNPPPVPTFAPPVVSNKLSGVSSIQLQATTLNYLNRLRGLVEYLTGERLTNDDLMASLCVVADTSLWQRLNDGKAPSDPEAWLKERLAFGSDISKLESEARERRTRAILSLVVPHMIPKS